MTSFKYSIRIAAALLLACASALVISHRALADTDSVAITATQAVP